MIQEGQTTIVAGDRDEIEIFHGRVFYDVLKIDADATVDEIEEAYTKQIGDLQIDRSDDALGKSSRESLMLRRDSLNEAYETLRDPERRKKYDAMMNCMIFGKGNEVSTDQANSRYNFQGENYLKKYTSDDELSIKTEKHSSIQEINDSNHVNHSNVTSKQPSNRNLTPNNEISQNMVAVPLSRLLEAHGSDRKSCQGQQITVDSVEGSEGTSTHATKSRILDDRTFDVQSYAPGDSITASGKDMHISCMDVQYACKDVVRSLAGVPNAFSDYACNIEELVDGIQEI